MAKYTLCFGSFGPFCVHFGNVRGARTEARRFARDACQSVFLYNHDGNLVEEICPDCFLDIDTIYLKE